ncbi:hypothetical protein [Brevibacillus borstelensis]|uniref:hypothetical protein n=1 Tax=Brevibacillus borstelensis TaxID=45462 RepID=UPI0030C61592
MDKASGKPSKTKTESGGFPAEETGATFSSESGRKDIPSQPAPDRAQPVTGRNEIHSGSQNQHQTELPEAWRRFYEEVGKVFSNKG